MPRAGIPAAPSLASPELALRPFPGLEIFPKPCPSRPLPPSSSRSGSSSLPHLLTKTHMPLRARTLPCELVIARRLSPSSVASMARSASTELASAAACKGESPRAVVQRKHAASRESSALTTSARLAVAAR
eukprot:6172962-Pleurochrysis_carterae.AAC.4